MHLIHTNQRPAYMAEMVELTATFSSRSGLRSASHFLYRKPVLKTKFGERAFRYADPGAWNSMPNYKQFESSAKHFKKLIKTYLFSLHRHFNSFNVCRNMKCPPVYFVGGQ